MSQAVEEDYAEESGPTPLIQLEVIQRLACTFLQQRSWHVINADS